MAAACAPPNDDTNAAAAVTEEDEEDAEMVDSQEEFDAQSQYQHTFCSITDADVNPFPLMKMPAEIRNEIYRACLTRPFNILLSRREPPPPERKPEEPVDVVELSDTEEEGESVLAVANGVSGSINVSAVLEQSGSSENPTPGLHSWANRTTRPVRLLNTSSSTQASTGAGTTSTTRASTRSTQQQAQAQARAQLRELAAAKPDPPRVPRPQDEDPLLVNLLSCSKTVYQEARSILYAENLFALDLDTALPTLAALHQRSRRQIKHVEIEIPCYNEILERFQETVRLSLRYCWGLKKLVVHMPFTLPGADGSGTTGNTTVYANGFDILRWLPRPCEVVLRGQICKEIEQVVSKNANLARTLDEVTFTGVAPAIQYSARPDRYSSITTAEALPPQSANMAATTNGEQSFSSIPDAVEAFARGEFLIVLDSPHRENEGDLIIAAADLTPSKAAFLIRHTSGYLCAPLTPSLAARLALPQMVSENLDPNRTAYTITIDAAEDVTTGISAQDRSTTCLKLADPKATKQSFRRPGHVVPLQAREGGVRARAGHTEAAVDLCRLAGKELVGVIAELVEDGEGVEGRAEMKGGFGMMRRDGCLAFARRYGLKVITIEDLIRYLESEGKGKA
ncbi:hypothetical protein B0A54_11763 [Friedmanniomyces endolithicus]|uniref:3,4-dihydroxy-2-butanone 4-phosphate synthase n=1 Tax=Friedmanniomyces endolithicus TaxID=329885 RepID=A0A4V5N6Z4_9PEZI|nr:hypothetical protein B0A54_11763 [Friedmanniomyces endolithicus]